MKSPSNTLRSKWGFHPCDYQWFLKLKSLHRWYWQTVYDFHRWHRWWRKEPQNRVGPEPKLASAFVKNEPWLKPVRVHGADGVRVYPKTVVDHGIVVLYQRARRPQDVPSEPFDEATRERIGDLFAKASQHFEEA